jgi:hypothetical protein
MKQRSDVNDMVTRLSESQVKLTQSVMETVTHDDLEEVTDDDFTVNDTLQMWMHELRSHHRDLILARGRLTGDNPHFHVPHFVRQANEEFGRFIGELSALSDEDLDRRVEPNGRTVREITEHVIGSLEGYLPSHLVKGRTDDE